METYNLIIAGTIGSVITLFLTAIFDYLKEVYRSKIHEQKILKIYKTPGKTSASTAVRRLALWAERYQKIVSRHKFGVCVEFRLCPFSKGLLLGGNMSSAS